MKNFSRQRDNKKNNGKRTKGVTCYECKKPGHIRSECPRFKFKGKRTKEKKKAFKATWNDSSDLEKEDENQEAANLCFMALKDKEVCLKSTKRKNQWYLDSGCSRHMTGDKE